MKKERAQAVEPKEIQILNSSGVPFNQQDSSWFGASRNARELARWTPSYLSADAANFGETESVASRALDLDRNNPIASGAVTTQVDNIIGTGLRLSANPDWLLLGREREWAREWSRKTDALFNSWALTPEFDAARQQTFPEMTAMQLRTMFLQGDGIALPLWLPNRVGAKWSTAVMSIDPARLESPVQNVFTEDERSGVVRGKFGEPVAYWVRSTHPNDVLSGTVPSDYEKIPALTNFGRKRVIHMYVKKRPGQTRGMSIMASVMAPFKMLDHYQRIELQTAVINSMIAAFIETPMDGEAIAELFGGHEEYLKEKNGWEVNLEGAGVIPLYPGEKMTEFNPGRPNSAYGTFIEAVMRTIGAGLNMPYEQVLKDFSKTNYSGARSAMLEAWRYFMCMRSVVSQQWCQPVYELFLEEAINKGEIEAPDFYDNKAAWTRAKWIGPGRGWVDPKREAEAGKIRMSTVTNMEIECAEQGLDWEEVLEQKKIERDKKLELGLPVDEEVAATDNTVEVTDIDKELDDDTRGNQGNNAT